MPGLRRFFIIFSIAQVTELLNILLLTNHRICFVFLRVCDSVEEEELGGKVKFLPLLFISEMQGYFSPLWLSFSQEPQDGTEPCLCLRTFWTWAGAVYLDTGSHTKYTCPCQTVDAVEMNVPCPCRIMNCSCLCRT